MEKRRDAGVIAVDSCDDTPTAISGVLIPTEHTVAVFLDETDSETVTVATKNLQHQSYVLMLVAAACMFVLSVGISTYMGFMTMQNQSVASPIIVMSDIAETSTELHYGAKVAFEEPDFFADLQHALMLSNNPFVAINFSTMVVTYVTDGTVALEIPIMSMAAPGSLRQTPAGLYTVDVKVPERKYTADGTVYPWHISFASNYVIHGEPVAGSDGVNDIGVTIATDDAKKLYELVSPDTLVIVHANQNVTDSFVYEPTVPDITAAHYLMADIGNDTVLASSDLDAVVPIASLTKLMTAIVALEEFEANQMITFPGRTFSTTTIPRLASSTQMRVYDLLRLMLVESSNEAAEVLADEMGRQLFVEKMNERAVDLGLVDTTFADTSGLSASNTSSLRDLLTLTNYLNENRSFILDVTADSTLFSIHAGMLPGLHNFNNVSKDDSFVAGKVGETRAAGQTSISLHEIEVQGTTRIVAIIILRAEDLPADVERLTQYLKTRF